MMRVRKERALILSLLHQVKTSNKRLSLPEQTLKVKVEDGVVRELKV